MNPKLWPTVKQSYYFWFGVAFIFCSLIAGVLGWSYKHEDEQFAKEGVLTDGLVATKKLEKNSDSDNRYLIEFALSDEQHRLAHGWVALSKPLWDGFEQGQKRHIAFLRSDPTKVRLMEPLVHEDGKVQFKLAAIGGVLGIVLLSVGLVKCFRQSASAV